MTDKKHEILDPEYYREYYRKQVREHQAILNYIEEGEWLPIINRLTDNLRCVLEDLYDAHPIDAVVRVIFTMQKGRGLHASLVPFEVINMTYDAIIDKPNINLDYDDTLTATLTLSEGNVRVSASVKAKIPDEIIDFMKDCGLVVTEFYTGETNHFQCAAGGYPF